MLVCKQADLPRAPWGMLAWACTQGRCLRHTRRTHVLSCTSTACMVAWHDPVLHTSSAFDSQPPSSQSPLPSTPQSLSVCFLASLSPFLRRS